VTRVRPGETAAALAVVAAALLLRCWHIASWPLWLDESWSRWMTEQSWAGLRDAAIGYDTHPPFYYFLLKAWTLIVPATPAGLRALSVLAGLLMLPLAWACAGRIEALRRAAWGRGLAAALVAVSPPLIVAAAQARPYALFALAFALALWAALALTGRDESKEGGGSPHARLASWALYLAGLEATFWLHSLGVLFAAALAGGLFLALAAGGRLRRDLILFLAVHAAALLAWLPGLLILLEQRRNWSASSWLHFSFADVPPGLASGLAVPGMTAVLILILAALGANALLARPSGRPAGILLLSAALLPAAATVALSILSSPVFLPRTLVPSVLPVLLLAAAGLLAIGRKAIRAGVTAVTLALLAFTAFAMANRAPEERWDALSAWLAPRVGAREALWLLPNEIALPFRYGSGGVDYPVRGLPAEFPAPTYPGPRPSGTKAVPAMTDADAARLVAEARAHGLTGIWVVSRMPHLFDPGGALPRAFGAGNRDLSDTRFAPLIVDHYRLHGPDPAR
jgi:uncharacterized membrane protein